MRTPVCDLLGIEFPILAFSHCRDVVAAVSKAGGFGVLGAVAYSPDQLEVELGWIESELGDRPYGVDVLIPVNYVGREEGGIDVGAAAKLIPDEHRRFVDGLMDKYDVPPLPTDDTAAPTDAPRRRGGAIGFSHRGAEALLDVALAHRPRLVASALGPPPPDLVERAHAQDIVVAALVGSVPHAVRQQAMGVDLIVAQGSEAGGHTGEIGTMVLVPDVVDAVAPTPVLAAGGIATGRQIAAAMALGAQGVWTGSVWLTTEEAETHPVVKEKFLAATAADTVRSRSSTGKPARQLRTAWTEEWDAADHPDPLPMPLHSVLIGEAQLRIARAAAAKGSGAEQLITYFVGQVVGRLNQVRPARQVVLDLVEEYIEAASAVAASLESTEA